MLAKTMMKMKRAALGQPPSTLSCYHIRKSYLGVGKDDHDSQRAALSWLPNSLDTKHAS